MKLKDMVSVTVFVAVILSLVMCVGCSRVEYKSVEAAVASKYYEPARVYSSYENICTLRPARYEITVDYNGREYVLNDSDTYNAYKCKIGETVTARLATWEDADGTIKYDIVSLG